MTFFQILGWHNLEWFSKLSHLCHFSNTRLTQFRMNLFDLCSSIKKHLDHSFLTHHWCCMKRSPSIFICLIRPRPSLRRNLTTSWWPFNEAHVSAVCPLSSSLFGFAPLLMRSLTTLMWPILAAAHTGVTRNIFRYTRTDSIDKQFTSTKPLERSLPTPSALPAFEVSTLEIE